MTDAVAAEERRKYAKMWGLGSYRKKSPGLIIAPRVYDMLPLHACATLIDYGCGEGKAIDYFRSRGVVCSGVDIVPLREDVIEACLWDLPAMESDFAFSADVLEHIPPERVRDVLRAIRERTRVAGAFTVATVQDGHGPKAGETLHLTVEPWEWWDASLRKVWPVVEHHQGDPAWRHLFIVRA